jgi:hypothetical protein
MRSRIAEQLREEQIEEMRRMTPSERVALVREISERDLQFYMAFQNVDRKTALRAIKRSHQIGRRYSRCIDESLK